MATLQELEQALVRADAAGDMDAARKLAAAVRAARQDAPNQIPGMQVPGTQAQPPSPSIGQQALGAGEALLTGITGATGGTAGMIGGTLYGMGESIVAGDFGTQQGVRRVQDNATGGAAALTYAPRTQAGQEIAQGAAQVLQNVAPPVLPMLAAPGQITNSIKAGAPAALAATQRVAAPVTRAAGQATQAVGQRMANPMGGPGPASIGAAEVDAGLLRQQRANELPVPIQQTLGQRTRNFEQQQFERETAKNAELGGPIRERFSDQQKKVYQNLDAFVDATGAEAPDLRTAGVAVNDALRSMVAQAKAKERALYKKAEKAGEMEAPVKTDALINFIQENDSFNTPELSGASLGLLSRELVRLGGATKGPEGQLIPGQLKLADMELVRRQLNGAINSKMDNQTNMRTGVQAKEIIDGITDGAGGDAYKAARAARTQRARDFENVTLVSSILGTKRGSTDRSIALEDVLRKSVISPSTSLDQTKHLGDLLQRSGSGTQAWKELQGATVRHIRDEAYKGITTDQNGNRVISPAALNKAITNLDQSGKLDYVLGKKNAELMRTLNEVAQETFTAPPGSVNTSNTSSALLNAIDTLGTFGVTGLPIPAVAAIRGLKEGLQNRQIKKRVDEALK
jgi:hypothetical protein